MLVLNTFEAFNVITSMCKLLRKVKYDDCDEKMEFKCGEIEVIIEGCCLPRNASRCIKEAVCDFLESYSGRSYGLEHIYGPVTAVVRVGVRFNEHDFDVIVGLGDIGLRVLELFRYDKPYNVVYDYEYSFEFEDSDLSDSRLRDTIVSGLRSKMRLFEKFDEDCVDIFIAMVKAIAMALIDCGKVMDAFRMYALLLMLP